MLEEDGGCKSSKTGLSDSVSNTSTWRKQSSGFSRNRLVIAMRCREGKKMMVYGCACTLLSTMF